MNIIDYIIGFIYPPRCIFCKEIMPLYRYKYICDECINNLNIIEGSRCIKCGKSIEKGEYCYDCRHINHCYDKGMSFLLYYGIIKEAMYGMKYRGRKEYASILIDLLPEDMLDSMRDSDALIPVPMHHKKEKKRGYNVANLLAIAISKKIDIPVDNELIYRNRDTRKQNNLSKYERNKNIEGAFSLYKNTKGYKKILLIDDIYTTGTTIDNCSQVIKNKYNCIVDFFALCTGIDNRGDSMELKNCIVCGKIFRYSGSGQIICPNCIAEEEKLFKLVKEYIYDNPNATTEEVSRETGAKLKQIYRWLREGRLEISPGSPIGIPCEKCGKPIKSGKYCKECNSILAHELITASKGNLNKYMEEEKKEKKEEEKAKKKKAKMHFLNKNKI